MCLHLSHKAQPYWEDLEIGVHLTEVGVKVMGEIDWEHPAIHRGNLITWADSEQVADRVFSIKWHSGAPVSL